MTNEYALDQLLRQELKWHADHNTGYYIAYTQNDARNGVLVLLKGHEDAPVKLELVLGKYRKYIISEPAPPKFRKAQNISLSRQKLLMLLKQARNQCLSKTLTQAEEEEFRDEILSVAIGCHYSS